MKRYFLSVVGMLGVVFIISPAMAAKVCLPKASGNTDFSGSDSDMEAESVFSYSRADTGAVSGKVVNVCAATAGTTAGELKSSLAYGFGDANKYCWKKIIYPVGTESWIYIGQYDSVGSCYSNCGFNSVNVSATKLNNILLQGLF